MYNLNFFENTIHVKVERTISVKEIVCQIQSSRDVFSGQGRLLIAEGSLIRVPLKELLEKNGIGLVSVWEEIVIPNTSSNKEIISLYKESIMQITDMFGDVRSGKALESTILVQVLQGLVKVCENEPNILRLMSLLRIYNEYTFQHCIAVGILSYRLGEWLELPIHDCFILLLSGCLHDIGKCKIDEMILNKPGALTDKEFIMMKDHTTWGRKILQESGFDMAIVNAAWNHHERLNGKGYPRGLRDSDIDLFSRIIAVTDIFHAMTSNRVYRKANSFYQVLDELTKMAFEELDPKVVLTFVKHMGQLFVGSQVCLTNGTIGLIVAVSPEYPTRPLIKTDQGSIDLRNHWDLCIDRVFI